jgi:uncharacterized protein
LHIAYNGGRFLVYASLGALAGWLGSMVDLGGSMLGAQRIAAMVAAGMVALFGVVWLLRTKGVRIKLLKPPAFLERALRLGHQHAARLSPTRRALTIGLLTPLLPCGWLYSYAVLAAGTGSPLAGTVTMAVFWMGTLPMMVALGAGSRAIMGRFGSALPTLMPLAVIITAVGMIVVRFARPPMDHSAHTMHVSQPADPAAPHEHAVIADD